MKRTPKELRKQKYNVWYNNSLEHFSSYLQDYEFTKNNDVISKFKNMYEMDSNLQQIKEWMNAEFLSYKLNCSLFKVQQIFHRYPPLRYQSILITNRLLDVLLKDYKYTNAKVSSFHTFKNIFIYLL